MLQQQHFIFVLFGLTRLLAQNYISSTIVGDGRSWSRDGFTNYGSVEVSSKAGLNKVAAVLVDSNRSKIYITEDWGCKIRVFAMKTNYLSTLSGDGEFGILNGNGNVAKWRHPIGLVMDSAGNLYVSDWDNCCIRKVTQGGVTSTFSGNCGVCGFADGEAATAQFRQPALMTIDENNTIYVADHNNGRIRKVFSDGSVTTFAGGFTMDKIDGPAHSARFNHPYDVKVDSSGNLFVADTDNHLIRKISTLGIVSLYAGTSIGHADGPWHQAKFRYPMGVALDNNGNIFVSDKGNQVIRKIDADRSVTTISGTIISGYPIRGYADGALSESLFLAPAGIHVDSNGTLYVADWDSSTVRVLYPENQCVSGSALCVGQDFKCRSGLCVQRLAGNGYGEFNEGDRLTAGFNRPSGLALDRSSGILYIADFDGNRIRKLTSDGMISTHAGDGVYDFVNGPTSSARFRGPRGVVVDSAGIVYVSDYGNHCIRKVAANTVSTLAGVCGTSGFNDGSGSSALFNQPAGLTLDNSGNLFVAGHSDGRIRKIDLSSLDVSTFAGGSTMGSTNGQGTTARFNYPYDVAFNSSGYLFVADKDNHMIRVISPSGYVSLFAGSSRGIVDGHGSAAMFNSPAALAFDDNGNLYVAEYDNQAVRKVSPSGFVTSFTNIKKLYGDQVGPALTASFKNPVGIEVDGNGTIYVSDEWAHKIEIICNMTCINGVADCFSNRCKCDIGWTGANCETLIPTSTTTTASTSTTTGTCCESFISTRTTYTTTKTTSIMTATEMLTFPVSYTMISLTATMTTTSTFDMTSSGRISALTSSRTYLQTLENDTSVLTEDSTQPTQLSPVVIIVASTVSGLIVIGSAVFCTSYWIRKRSRVRIKINGDQQLANSNQNLTALPNNNFPIRAPFVRSNKHNNGEDTSRSYIANNLTLHYDDIELKNRVSYQSTQSVSTSALYLPGFSILKLGIDFMLPERIDKLGKGGTGSIFGATLVNTNLVEKHGLTNVAVKIFPEGTGLSMSFAFYEIAIMNLIPPNPHICKFIGYTETPRCAIIMKQYEGSLNSLIKDKSIAIDPIFCLKIACDVVTGMKLIHGMNVLHLDIKPDNILWERLQDGSLNFCICDFGFASLVGDSRSIVSGIQVPKSVGVTVRYTAPEVFVHLALRTNSGRVNSDLHKKIDIFAFGMSMYSVMFGGSFWKDLEYDEIVQKIRMDERPSIDLLPSEMKSHEQSKILIDIVQECWKQNPSDRPSFSDISNILCEIPQ